MREGGLQVVYHFCTVSAVPDNPMLCAIQGNSRHFAVQTHQDEHSPRSTIQQRRVVFRTTHQVNYGEVIKVVGQGPQLGKWEVRTAPGDTVTHAS